MDQAIFQAVNGWIGKWVWLDAIGRFFGGDYFLYLFTAVIALLWLNQALRQRVYLALGSALIARGLVVEIIKRLAARPRPFELSDAGASFPSGHTTIYFVFAFAFYGTKYFWPFLFLAIAGSVARVFIGVHYPFDILAGAAIGVVAVFLLKALFKKQFLS
ncbi:MAG: phosphatase PAP2 family protein [Candidatus Doudnabacteria bacterium]|nr:phosphatase PAP2 family protein [Candidatus Doudnabacteria bacterium]